ncbi:hypothetical protein J6590_090807 [Homalodisca vitripennis]|nr:hypothetical protein J6590_090807 [Homalodisca vitripennis]
MQDSELLRVESRDIHTHETRGRELLRTASHRTVVFEHLHSIKNSLTPKAFKRRLKHLLVSQAFYNAGEFLAFTSETAQLHD